jgi:uncharacterized protein YjbJ (UPF0337 family)
MAEHSTQGSFGAKQLGGKIKEGAGKLLGDEELKTDGQADQAEGKIQILGEARRTKPRSEWI